MLWVPDLGFWAECLEKICGGLVDVEGEIGFVEHVSHRGIFLNLEGHEDGLVQSFCL